MCLEGRVLPGLLTDRMWLYFSFAAPLRGGHDYSHFRVQSTEAENLGRSSCWLRGMASHGSSVVSGTVGGPEVTRNKLGALGGEQLRG